MDLRHPLDVSIDGFPGVTLSKRFGREVVIESEQIFHVFSLKLGLTFAGPFFAMFWGEIDPVDTRDLKIELVSIQHIE